VVEGLKLVAAALDSEVEVEALFCEVDAGEACEQVVEGAIEAGVAVHRLGVGSLARIADTVTPQPLVAVARTTAVGIEAAVGADLVLVLVDVGDPGNAGTLLRTADSAGAGAVVLLGDSVDPFNPKSVRASAGAVFTLPIVVGHDVAEAVTALRRAGHRCLALSARGGRSYDDVDLTAMTAILLGSEAHGLPEAVVGMADEQVTIPMSGRTESLNVAMAGTIICFEARRQRRRAGP
jgi:TrmH family RNA methyltransferase